MSSGPLFPCLSFQIVMQCSSYLGWDITLLQKVVLLSTDPMPVPKASPWSNRLREPGGRNGTAVPLAALGMLEETCPVKVSPLKGLPTLRESKHLVFTQISSVDIVFLDIGIPHSGGGVHKHMSLFCLAFPLGCSFLLHPSCLCLVLLDWGWGVEEGLNLMGIC